MLGPDDAVLFGAAYDVTDGGQLGGPHDPSPRPHRRRARDDDPDDARPRSADRLATARRTLLEPRAPRRPQPARDDKVLAGWNGLALAALADAIVALEATGEQA